MPLTIASLVVTSTYVVVAVPLHLVTAFLVAEMMNQKIPLLSWFRTIYYLPAIVPSVAAFLLWSWIFNPEYGILNWGLRLIGIQGPAWLADPRWGLLRNRNVTSATRSVCLSFFRLKPPRRGAGVTFEKP